MKIQFCSVIFIFIFFFSLTAGAQVPKINSYSSANGVIFLDFDGHTVEGTIFNGLTGGNPVSCAASGLDNNQITTVFNRVAEDFRPFDVNVTTDSTVFLAAPLTKRIRLIFTTSWQWFGAAGGASKSGAFTAGDDTPGIIFTSCLNFNVKNIAEAASHETGHTLGLQHQSAYDNNCNLITFYYGGQGAGEIGWAPIMGVGYYQNSTRWYNGPGPLGCNTRQDDLAVITANNGFGFRHDDYGNNFTDAATAVFSGQQFSINGIIEKNNDDDMIKFTLPVKSNIRLMADPFNVGPNSAGANIDLQVSLYNAARELVNTYNPASLLSVSVDTILDAGMYFLKVEGKGNIYSPEYASLGSYSLQVKFASFKALPLRSLKLNGRVTGDSHQLQWEIDADETVTAQVLQVSSNGIDFNPVTEPAVNERNYQYRPNTLSNVQYRVKVTFDNGKAYYSNIITLRKTGENNRPRLVSNLVNNNTVAVSSPGTYNYMLYDMAGKIVRKGTLTNGYNTISTTGVLSGIYIMKFADQSEIWSDKIMLQ